MRIILSTFLLCLTTIVFGQNTVGTISFDQSVINGYNLHYPHNQPTVYLLDNCGRVVHEWADSADVRPGNVAILLENGNLVKTKRNASVAGDAIWAGGGGGIIEILDWDNNKLWSYELNNATERLHHDIAVTQNGTIIAIVWELKTLSECIAAGRDTSNMTDIELWPDKIIEIEPIGTDSANIIWEWNAWDHLVQDFDATKANFGVIKDNPGKIDINYFDDPGADWLHANSIDYNEILDQIIISIPEFNEMWIIDHSTTTAEAATSSGGNSGRGGDLMFRWGNPMAYDRGDSTDMKCFYQHDVHWASFGLPTFHPDFGKIFFYNNRFTDSSSTVNIINPQFDTYSWLYPYDTTNLYGPADYEWSYTHPEAEKMYSTGLSGVQRLENGNTLICVGRRGYTFEITPTEDIIWEYKNPLVQGNAVAQGTVLNINQNLNFRFNRYPADYAAFMGKDLTAGNYLEVNPDSTVCNNATTNVVDIITPDKFNIYPNPTTDWLTIEMTEILDGQLRLYDVLGRTIHEENVTTPQVNINMSELNAGFYFVTFEGRHIGKVIKQ